MIYLRMGVSLAALLFAGFLGYRWGASGLEEARAQLAAIARTADEAKAAQVASQQRLDAQMKAQADEHAARLKAQAEGFEAQKAELSASLGKVSERLKVVDSQRQGNSARLAQLQAGMATATGAQLAELTQLKDELERKDRQMARQQAGLSCLATPVPAEELATLNRVLAPALPGGTP